MGGRERKEGSKEGNKSAHLSGSSTQDGLSLFSLFFILDDGPGYKQVIIL